MQCSFVAVIVMIIDVLQPQVLEGGVLYTSFKCFRSYLDALTVIVTSCSLRNGHSLVYVRTVGGQAHNHVPCAHHCLGNNTAK